MVKNTKYQTEINEFDEWMTHPLDDSLRIVPHGRIQVYKKHVRRDHQQHIGSSDSMKFPKWIHAGVLKTIECYPGDTAG